MPDQQKKETVTVTSARQDRSGERTTAQATGRDHRPDAAARDTGS
jgi:hypothetical protein